MIEGQTNGNGTGVPEWMAAYGIKPSEWLSNTKPQLHTLMRPDKPLKVQLWANGILHTAGYKGEVARTMRGGKIVNFTPSVAIREIHKEAVEYYRSGGVVASDADFEKLKETKEHVRRGYEDLEDDGVCERRANGKLLKDLTPKQRQSLSPGSIEYSFFLRPKPAKPENVRELWAAQMAEPTTSSDDVSKAEVAMGWLPPVPISQVLKTFGFARPAKEVITSPDYQKMISQAWAAAKKSFEEVAMGWLPPVAAGRTPEVAVAGGAFEREVESKPETTTTADAPTPDGAPSEELVVVAKMGITAKRARAFLAECRQAYPGCTIDDIMAVIDSKSRGFGRDIRNPVGLLLTSVPQRLLAAWQEAHQSKGASA